MLERSPYPLLSLKILGSLCPCLEKDEDGPARRAAWALSSTPIRWHRRLRGSSSSSSAADSGKGAVGSFLSGMFGGSSGGGDSGGGGGGGSYDPLEGATLSVVDAGSGPQLVASPPGFSTTRKKCIPLKMIKKVQARQGGIINLGSRSGIEVLDSTGQEVLRFDMLKSAVSRSLVGGENKEEDWENAEDGGGADVEDADEATRDDLIDRLQVLIEWERRRQAYIVTLGEDETENAEEDYVNEYDDEEGVAPASPRSGKKGVLAEKAQKIKHFAQREIELQKMKKERENRKAKYVKEAGGLKYTAIAMANRS